MATPTPLIQRSFATLGQQFEQALGWLKANRIDIEGTRFSEYPSSILTLERVPAMSMAERRAASEDVFAAFLAMQDVADLVRTYQFLGSHDGERLRHRLKRGRVGPATVAGETHVNSDPRNVLAELAWAAVLAGAGMDVELEYDPDVILRLPRPGGEVRLVFEVKRPQSIQSLAKNVAKAGDQIRQAVAREVLVPRGPIAGGVVVVVLDKLLPYEPRLLDGLPAAEARRVLREGVLEFAAAFHQELHAGRRPEVVGVILWWRPLGIVGTGANRSWTECFQRHILHYDHGALLPWRNLVLEDLAGKLDSRTLGGRAVE